MQANGLKTKVYGKRNRKYTARLGKGEKAW